ncbi:MAG TPA: LuxR C-terminal-related transcriptional regulator, partial [Roseiflexaceae bacterium]
LGAHQLKDLSRPEQIFQLVSPDLPADFPPLRTVVAPPASPSAPAAPLLTTKLYAPPAWPNLVPRPRLIERLRAGLLGKLTLIAAPAGFGKTTLVSEWIASNDERQTLNDKDLIQRSAFGVQRSDEASVQRSAFSVQRSNVAWVALDAGDNDPLRFWSYVIAALDTLRPGVGAGALALLQSIQPPPIEAVLTPLLNALNTLPGDAMLALDDYHVIDAPPIHRALMFLIDHLPRRLHLLITTRADPPLLLNRLRARGELTELRAADLRFTPEETAAFLRELRGLPLANDQIATLDAHTEGWIAGLQLAALAMRDRADINTFIAAFAGSNRFVVDYLADEVIDRLPSHIQSFLLQTAILDRMCGPLCDAVLGLTTDHGISPVVDRRSSVVDSYSQLILDELERSNLFIVALDDERYWYRYHQLFAEVLRHRLLSGATAAKVEALHCRAAVWFEQRDLIVEAMQHALMGNDVERAARLIEQTGASLAIQGQVHTVLGWLNALPATFIRERPVLGIIHAAMLMYTNQPAAAEARLRDAEQCVQTGMPTDQARGILGQVAVLRGNLARFVGDLAGCVALARQALDLLPENEVFAHVRSLMRIGRTGALVDAAHDFLTSGDATSDTERQVVAAIATARASGNLFATIRSITLLARLQILQGRLRAAAATYAEAACVGPGQDGLRALVNSAAYYFGMGELLREWNDLDAAEHQLAQGMELVRGTLTVDARVATVGFLTLARIQQARGDGDGASATLAGFANLARERNFVADLLRRGAAAQARLALARGDLRAAAGWAEASGLHADDEPRYPREAEYLTLARVLIAEGRADRAAAGREPPLQEALRLLERLLAAAEAGGRMGGMIEILGLRALALHAQDDLGGALAALTRALALAEPEGYIRVFADAGAPMADLLRATHKRGIAPAYVAKLLAAFPSNENRGLRTEEERRLDHSALNPQSSVLVEPLTDREMEVLRLLADGDSNRDIARKLILSLGTVKKHINNIFGKLGVQSRTQAVVKARDLHLI